MVKIYNKTRIFAMGLLFIISLCTLTARADSSAPIANDSISPMPEREAIFQGKSLSLAFSHFTWGVEVGSSLDMTTHDFSSFDVDAVLGFKNSFIKIAGVGAGIHRSIHKGNNFFPVYAVFRTSFRKEPSLLFMNLQAGYTFNTIDGSHTSGDFYGALGLGINLSQSKTVKSYIIASLACQYFREESMEKIDLDTNHILYAKLVFGVNF